MLLQPPHNAFLLLFGVIIAKLTVAEYGDTKFEFWNNVDCNTEESTAFDEVASGTILMDSEDKDSCASYSIDLVGFEEKGRGLYTAYLDPGAVLADDCQLVFFYPEPEETQNFNCDSGSHKFSLSKNAGCVRSPIPKHFAMGHCCGDACSKYLPDQMKRDEGPVGTPYDVTAVKKAPIIDRAKREDPHGPCEFTKEVDPEVRFLKTRKAGQSVDCPAESEGECVVTGDYTATTGLSHSTTDSQTLTVGASGGTPFNQVSVSYGIEHSVTEEYSSTDAFSQSYSLNIPAGTSGYLTFKQKVLCGKGRFEGPGCDAALQTDDNEWCLTALTRGTDGRVVPDGVWGTFFNY